MSILNPEEALREQVQKLCEAIGVSKMDYERFLDSGTIDWDKCDLSSPLGKHIEKVKDDCSMIYSGCD